MKNQRLISLFLALIMCISVAVACNGGSDNPADTKSESGVTTSSKEDDGRYHADIPDKNYDGKTFTVICRSLDSDWADTTLIGDSESDVVMTESNWRRNVYVEDLLGVKLEFSEIAGGVVKGTIYNIVSDNAMAGDYICDMAVMSAADACYLISSNNIRNLDDVPYIDLEQPWWQQKLNDSMALLNKHYFAINYMLINDKLDTYALFFNKDNFDDNGITYPYTYVENETWTVDKLKKIITDFGWDLNNNGRKDYEDQFGMSYQRIDSFFTGFGLLGSKIDSDGYPEMVEFTERVQDAYEAMYALRNNYEWNEWGYWDDGHPVEAVPLYLTLYPNCLFVCGPLQHYRDVVPYVENSIGIVPSPWLDENQKEYYGRAGLSGTTAVTVLGSSPDPEMSGIVIEALGAEALNVTYPAFFETLLTNRYAQDEESKKMISIIIDSEVIDLDALFTWGNINRQLELNIAAKVPSASSVYAKYFDSAKAAMEKTIDEIIDTINE